MILRSRNITIFVFLAVANGLSARAHCVMTSHGCLALNPNVVQSTINETICKKGYTKLVRPAISFTKGVKQKLMRAEGIASERANEFELDHIVPLTLGGHPHHLSK